MQRLMVGPPVRDLLLQPGENVELCDDGGRTFGYFVCGPDTERSVYDWAKAQIGGRELDQRRHEVGGKTTAELLAQMKEQCSW
jgi:hypothetical protein